jgi:hypothetical protein
VRILDYKTVILEKAEIKTIVCSILDLLSVYVVGEDILVGGAQ